MRRQLTARGAGCCWAVSVSLSNLDPQSWGCLTRSGHFVYLSSSPTRLVAPCGCPAMYLLKGSMNGSGPSPVMRSQVQSHLSDPPSAPWEAFNKHSFNYTTPFFFFLSTGETKYTQKGLWNKGKSSGMLVAAMKQSRESADGGGLNGPGSLGTGISGERRLFMH